jgi:hypothetical protein
MEASGCRTLRAPRPCSGTAVPSPARDGYAPADRTGGEVFGQLTADRGIDEGARAGDQLLDLAADIGTG